MPAPLLSNARRIALAFILLGAAAVYLIRWQERAEVTLILGAGPVDTEGFSLAQAVSDVVQSHHPSIRILVVPTQGSAQNAELLGSRGLDLAIIQAEMRTPPAARLIAPLFSDAYQLLAREGSGIRSPGDLRGKTVAVPVRGSAGFGSFWSVAAHYGMDESGLTALPMSVEAATWALGSEAVDALFLSRPPGSSVVRRVIDAGNAYVVPIEQAAAIQLNRPALEVGVVPKGSYRGEPPVPPADLSTATVRILLTGREDLDASLIRDITEVLFERRRELMERSPLAGFILSPDRSAGTYLPVHDGAQRYYDRERPSFLQENAEVIALLLSIGALGISSLFRMADQGRRRRLEAYNAEMLALYGEVKDSHDPVAIGTKREEMLQVLVRVLDDAEEGQVTEEGFQVFSLTWQAVYGALRDRLVLGPLTPSSRSTLPGASPAGEAAPKTDGGSSSAEASPGLPAGDQP